jgi:hypothetical protein
MDLSIAAKFMSLSPDMMYRATKMVETVASYFPGDVESQENYLRENLIDVTLEYALTLLEDKKIRDYMGVSVYTNGTTFSAPTLALYNVASMPEMKQRIQAKLNAKSNIRREALDPVGREDADIDNDGKPNDKNDKYIRKRRSAVAAAIAKRRQRNEEVEQIDEISAALAITASQKADNQRRLAANAGDRQTAAKKAAQASRIYSKVGKLRAKERMNKEEFELDELYKGKHGQSEKEYQAGRSDAGKRISGDSETGPRYYTLGRARGAKPDAPTKPGARPVNTPKLSSSEKEYHQYNKSDAKRRAAYNKVGGSKGLPEEYDLVNEEDPCWKGYTQVGMKKKGGREVPNCVPSKGVPKAKGYKEDFSFEELAEFAADYFIAEGLNEYGIDILIEEMGIDAFCYYVELLSEEEEVLLEWRRGAGGTKVRGSGMSKGGKSIGSLKGGAKASAIRGTAEHKARKAEKEKESSKSSGMTSALKSQSKIANVKKSQPETKSTATQTKEKAKGGILGALKARAERDTALLRKTVDTAKKVGARRAAEVKATYDAVRARGKEAEKSASATRARRKATVAAGRAAQAAGRTAVKAAGAAGAAAGQAVAAKRAGKSNAAAAGRAAGAFVKKMTKEEKELLTRYFIESEIAFNYDEVNEIFESIDQEHFDYFIEQANLMLSEEVETTNTALNTIQEKLSTIYNKSDFQFANWKQLTEASEDEATKKFVKTTSTLTTNHQPKMKGKVKDGVIINPTFKMTAEEIESIEEKAPPGKKYERMVKHIKKGYSEDGLTKKERGIAYATAWKKYKAEQVTPDAAKDSQRLKNQQMMSKKQLMLQQQRLQLQKQGKLPMGHAMEEVELDETKLGWAARAIEKREAQKGGLRRTRTPKEVQASRLGSAQLLSKDATLEKQKAPGDTGLHKGATRKKDEYDDEAPRRRYRDDHPSLSARERNPNLR